MSATQFGAFKVELDVESGCLEVTNADMKFRLLIGGDALDVTDLEGHLLDQMEIPV